MSESEPTRPEAITGEPQAGWSPPGYGGPSYGQQPGYPLPQQMPMQAAPRQDDSGATTALVLGIVALALGFLAAGSGFLLSPVALVLGWRSKRRIDASQGALGGRGNAQAGFVLGIVGTVFLLLGLLLLVVFIGLFAASVAHSSGGTF